MAKDKLRHETLALHGGAYRADPVSGAVAVPIYQTTSYQFQDTGHASRLFALEELGNIYTRVQNPTWDALETRIAALEGGAAALAVASGQAASAYSVLNLAQAGDNIVSSTDLYGGTWTLFAQTLKQFGIETRFVDPSDPEAFRRATDAKTRAYYAEILPNPKLHVFPIREVADIGRSLGVPLIADNTATPLIARPFEHGAAVVVYSATKYIGGHDTSIGGLIIDGGNFPWEQHAERFPLLTHRMKPTTAPFGRRLRSLLGRSPMRSARALSSCATLARRFRRSTPSSSCRGSRRCRCGFANTMKMQSCAKT
jgi:O-acetylhomoserine (thiol)-lyase